MERTTRPSPIGMYKDFTTYRACGLTHGPRYDAIWGTVVGFRARPVVGGHFALLMLPK